MINELKNKDSVNTLMLVKSVVNGVTNKGAKYLSLVLQDKTGTIDGKFWDVSEAQSEIVKAGHVFMVSAEVLEYNKVLQLRVNRIQNVNEEELDLSEFIISSTISQEELKAKLKKAIYSIKNDNYRKIILEVYKEAGEPFFSYPAAAKIHHSFLGGLAQHTTGMVDLADCICNLYPQLNRDLLVSGVLVHDVGKMVELSGPLTTEYTLEGKLCGHISIMHAKVCECAKKLGLENSEEALLLRHMILSHHGHYEYGSPVLPMVEEAEILYLIDNIDARINTLDQALSTTNPGEFTAKLFALENRQFYKPKK